MPLDPTLMASCSYYVCDSEMVEQGRVASSLMSGREMKEALTRGEEGKAMYLFGEVVGVSERRRIGVDYAGRRAGV